MSDEIVHGPSGGSATPELSTARTSSGRSPAALRDRLNREQAQIEAAVAKIERAENVDELLSLAEDLIEEGLIVPDRRSEQILNELRKSKGAPHSAGAFEGLKRKLAQLLPVRSLNRERIDEAVLYHLKTQNDAEKNRTALVAEPRGPFQEPFTPKRIDTDAGMRGSKEPSETEKALLALGEEKRKEIEETQREQVAAERAEEDAVVAAVYIETGVTVDKSMRVLKKSDQNRLILEALEKKGEVSQETSQLASLFSEPSD